MSLNRLFHNRGASSVQSSFQKGLVRPVRLSPLFSSGLGVSTSRQSTLATMGVQSFQKTSTIVTLSTVHFQPGNQRVHKCSKELDSLTFQSVSHKSFELFNFFRLTFKPKTI